MKNIKVLCSSCKTETNHQVIYSHKLSEYDEDTGMEFWEYYQIIKCLGCDEISFRMTESNSEDYDPNTGDIYEIETLYPDREEERQPINNYQYFPPRTKKVYLETLKSLNNSTPLLTAIGLRSLIESICIEQKTGTTYLEEGINKLAQIGWLSKEQAKYLHELRFMGNQAVHKMSIPTPNSLVTTLDIAETILKTVYILPKKVNKIKKKKINK